MVNVAQKLHIIWRCRSSWGAAKTTNSMYGNKLFSLDPLWF